MPLFKRREPPDPEKARANIQGELARHPRLSIPDFLRVPIGSAASFAVGMTLGLAHGSKMAGLRFRAEHAHKLPQTTTGWFLYHKSKNYQVAYGGIREGLRMGAKVSLWTTAMFVVENMFDHYRGKVDAANTVLACVATSGALSLWNRFPLVMAARTTKTALAVGLVYGALQDAIGLARGRRIGYVEFVRRRLGRGDSAASDVDRSGIS